MSFTPTAGPNGTHHITTNRVGALYGWFVVPGTYRVRRANDFAPKIASGQLQHSDLDLFQTIDMEDFSHGIGAEYLRKDPAQFYDADTELETAIPNQVTLAAQWILSDSGFVATAFADYGNYFYAGGASSVRKYDPVAKTWADSKTGLAAGVAAMLVSFNKLFVGLGSTSKFWTWDGATWAQNATYYASCFEKYQKLLWFGSSGNVINYDGVTTYNTIAVGDPQSNVTALVAQSAYLFIFKDDGRVYLYDGTTVYDVTKNAVYAGNYLGAVTAQGFTYFGVLSDIMRLQTSTTTAPSFQTLTPTMAQDHIYGWGLPIGFTASPKYVYCLTNGANNSYPAVLKWNGSGWHVAYKGAAGATAHAVYYSVVTGSLWVNDGSSRYQQFTTVNDTPYPNYTSLPRSLYLAHFTGGLDDVPKMFRDITIVSENLTSSIKVNLYYQADRSGTWVYFGTAKTSPNQTLAFASGSAISATDLWIRLDFITNDPTISPKAKSLHVSYQPRPKTVWAIDARLEVDNHMHLLDQGANGIKDDPNTIATLISELQSISDAALPITLVGMDGITYQVMATKVGWDELARRDGYTSFTVPISFLQALAISPISVFHFYQAGVSQYGFL